MCIERRESDAKPEGSWLIQRNRKKERQRAVEREGKTKISTKATPIYRVSLQSRNTQNNENAAKKHYYPIIQPYHTFSIFFIPNKGRHKKNSLKQRIKNSHAHDTEGTSVQSQRSWVFLFTFFIAEGFFCYGYV